MHLKVPCITHTVSFLLLRLDFYTKDPDGLRNTVNIFMFPYLSLAEGLEADMISQ